MSRLLFEEETFKIRGAAFEVYREIGCGFLEAVYHECLALEFSSVGILFSEKKELQLSYKSTPLKQRYIPDFVCFEQIIVEIKAVKQIASEHRAQVMNYLKATKLKLGLLINFGSYPKAEIERIVL
ncbi:MAG TPA: GxxExxY protein [Chitinispirillaceae bacterium]|nr:GxxExxY protein [Chitinispirillaceae bacterium]